MPELVYLNSDSTSSPLVTGHFSCSEWDHTHSCLSLPVPHLFICFGVGKVIFVLILSFWRLNLLPNIFFPNRDGWSNEMLMYFWIFSCWLFDILKLMSHQVLQVGGIFCCLSFLKNNHFPFSPCNPLWLVTYLSCCKSFISAALLMAQLKLRLHWYSSSWSAGLLRAHSGSQTEEKDPPKGFRAESWLNVWSSLVSSVLRCV